MGASDTARQRRRWDRAARYYDLLTAAGDRMMGLARGRSWAVGRLPRGRILEVGAGTGKNVPHHPPGGRIILTDVSPEMLRRAKRRARGRPEFSFVVTDAQALAFKDQAFDAALATCVFCSVADPAAGLHEVRRTLKPGAPAVLLEHIRPPGLRGRLFDFLDPLASRLLGPHINRRTLETVQRAGLPLTEARDVFSDWVKLIVARRPSDG